MKSVKIRVISGENYQHYLCDFPFKVKYVSFVRAGVGPCSGLAGSELCAEKQNDTRIVKPEQHYHELTLPLTARFSTSIALLTINDLPSIGMQNLAGHVVGVRAC